MTSAGFRLQNGGDHICTTANPTANSRLLPVAQMPGLEKTDVQIAELKGSNEGILAWARPDFLGAP